ncbi:hypothetical protein LCGC14_2797730, partial [marine sediment metagenome]
WNLAPVDTSGTVVTLQRKGDVDTNTEADFVWSADKSKGTQNPILVFPYQGNPQAPGTTGFGFGADVANYAIHTNVETEMLGANASFWTRIPFQSPDPALFETLRLEMKYNDGFVAYLNGSRIARNNDPDDLLWNSSATAQRSAEQSLLTQTFDVTASLDALLPGVNILAVHGLNLDASDDNFLLLPKLIGTYRGEASMGLSLDPGINRVVVQVFEGEDGTGKELQRGFVDIWSSSTGGMSPIPEGPIFGELAASDGPFVITGEVTVEAGKTLVIRPGTTVFFDEGARLTVNGRLLAEGTEHDQIRFTRTPGSNDNWDGIQFVDTMEDNRIAYTMLEYATTDAGMVGLENSNLLIDHATFDHARRRRIRSVNSSLIVRNSTFTEIFPDGMQPLTDDYSEHVWGENIPPGGH